MLPISRHDPLHCPLRSWIVTATCMLRCCTPTRCCGCKMGTSWSRVPSSFSTPNTPPIVYGVTVPTMAAHVKPTERLLLHNMACSAPGTGGALPSYCRPVSASVNTHSQTASQRDGCSHVVFGTWVDRDMLRERRLVHPRRKPYTYNIDHDEAMQPSSPLLRCHASQNNPTTAGCSGEWFNSSHRGCWSW